MNSRQPKGHKVSNVLYHKNKILFLYEMVHLRIASMSSYPRRWQSCTNNRTSATLPDIEDDYRDVIHKMYLFIYISHA